MDRYKVRFGDHELDQYQKDQEVVVNIDGKWQVVKLDAKPIKKGDKKYEISINGGQTIVVPEAPRIIMFETGKKFEDAKKGVELDIADIHITADGRVEYDVKDLSGKVYKGVPQEFMGAWKKTVEMEEEVGKIEQTIQTLGDKSQKELRGKVGELKAKVIDVFANLPKLSRIPGDVQKMARQSKVDVQRAMQKIEALHKEAEERISDLNKEIATVKTKGTAKKPKIVHAETEKDKAARKAKGESEAGSKKQKAELMLKDLTATEIKTVENKKRQMKAVVDAEHAQKVQEWKNAQSATAPTPPPSERKFTLDPADKDEVDQEYLDKEQEPEWKDKESKAIEIKKYDESLQNDIYANVVAAETQELAAKKLYKEAQHNHDLQQWQALAPARRGPQPTFNADHVYLTDPEKTAVFERVKKTSIIDFLRVNPWVNRHLEILRKEKARNERDRRKLLADKSDYAAGYIDDENISILEHITKEWPKEFKQLQDRLKTEKERDLKDLKREKLEEARNKYQADHRKWEAAKNAPKPPEPAEINLKPAEEKSIKEKARVDRIKELINDPINADLKTEIEVRRKAKAQKGDPRPGYLNGAKDDYDPSKIDEINLELFDDVIKDWQKDYVFEEKKLEAGDEVLDFNTSTTETTTAKEILADFQALLNDPEILKSPGVPKDAYRAVYQRILNQEVNTQNNIKSLQSLESAKLIPFSSIKNQKDLEAARESFVSLVRKQLNDFANEISNIKITEMAGEKYEQKEKMTPLDLSVGLVENILSRDVGKAKAAMKALYRGDAIEEFKELMPDQKPARISDATLRKAGIKDWQEFKELWDATLAKEVAKSLEAMAEERIRRKVAELMDSLSGLWTKMGAIKGQLALRSTLQLILAGGVRGLRAVTDHYVKALSDVAVVAGGAASGAGKWGIGKLIFGKTGWAKEGNEAMKAAQEGRQDKLIDDLVDESFGGAPTPTGPQNWLRMLGSIFKSSKPQHTQTLDGLPMMSAIIADAIRDTTAGEIKVMTTEGEKTLSGANRLRYERALAQLETHDPESQQAKELALTFSQLNRQGDILQQQEFEKEKNKGKLALGDNLLQEYSGRGSLKKAVAFNTGLSGIFLASSTARLVFGGLVGAYGGWKAGERRFAKKEQESAKEKLAERMAYFHDTVRLYHTFSTQKQLAEKPKLRSELIYLKKFLHGNATKEDLMAAIHISESGPVVDEMLLTQIEAVVHDAEGLGILLEKKEDAMNLEKVLAVMKEYQGKVSEKEQAKIWTRFKKAFGKNANRLIGAAAVGVGTGLLYKFGGGLIGKAINKLRGNSGYSGEGVLSAAEHHRHDMFVAQQGHDSIAPTPSAPEGEHTPVPISGVEVHQLTTIDQTQNFAADHHLSVESAKYLESLPKELQGNTPALERILAASHIDGHKDLHFTSSGVNSLVESGGERRAVIFEELQKVDKAAAADYLQKQVLGKHHLSYITEFGSKKGKFDYQTFAQQYDPNNKKMAHALFRAMQGKENTQLANAGMLVEANEHRSGVTVGVRGKELQYFGLDKDDHPILSGKGEILVQKTELADVHAWAVDNNAELQHELGHAQFEHAPAVDAKGNFIVDHGLLDKQGNSIPDTSSPVPEVAWTSDITHTDSKQVVVADTLATYKPNTELAQHVEGKTVVSTTAQGDVAKAGTGVDTRNALQAEPVSKKIAGESVNDNKSDVVQPISDIEFRQFSNKFNSLIKIDQNNDIYPVGDAKQVMSQKIRNYNQIYNELQNKYNSHESIGVNRCNALVKMIENDKDLTLYRNQRDVVRQPMIANGGEFLRVWISNSNGEGTDVLIHKAGSTFSVNENGSLVEKNSTGATTISNYDEVLDKLGSDSMVNNSVYKK